MSENHNIKNHVKYSNFKYSYYLPCLFKVTRLCDLTADEDAVTSVSWNDRVSNFIFI